MAPLFLFGTAAPQEGSRKAGRLRQSVSLQRGKQPVYEDADDWRSLHFVTACHVERIIGRHAEIEGQQQLPFGNQFRSSNRIPEGNALTLKGRLC